MKIEAPATCGYEDISAFSQKLRDMAEEVDDIIIDFAGVGFVTPAWAVIVGGLLRRLKTDRPDMKRKAINFKHLTYAAHIGFFEYFGLKYGQAPDAAPGSETYIPISIRKVGDVLREAEQRSCAVGDVLHAEAERLSSVLTRTDKGDLQDTLAYSIREVLRNVVEHSQGTDFVFAAQYWPTRSKVEVVVADQGLGLLSSLNENPRLRLESDEAALRQAILPGVSSKAWRRGRRRDEWANSGYGLFMTERLCGLGGTFRLLSGSRMLTRSGGKEILANFNWQGTTVVLELDTSQISDLSGRLRQLRDEGAKIEKTINKDIVGPSRASSSPKPSKWNPKP